ncbi:hypothetical protein [Nocardia brasiliensis]
MKKPVSQQLAEVRAARKFEQLYKPLMELIDRLQDLEPGGTLVDDIVFDRNQDGSVHIEYTAHPVSLIVKDKDKALVLRVVDTSGRSRTRV